MLATQLNDRVKTGRVRKSSVIQLIEYICSTVQNRKISPQHGNYYTRMQIIGNPAIVESNVGAQKTISNGASGLKLAQKNFNHLKNEWEIFFETPTVDLCPDEDAFYSKMQFSFRPISEIESAENNSIIDGRSVLQELAEAGFSSVLAVKAAKVSDFTGKSIGTISSTQLFINPDLSETQTLREWFDQGGKDIASQSISRENMPESGEEILGCPAKELYLMKYERGWDDTKFSEIIRNSSFRQFLFRLKIKEEFMDQNWKHRLQHQQLQQAITPPAEMLSKKFLRDGETPSAASATLGMTMEAAAAGRVNLSKLLLMKP
ncbi:hypothetical protein HAX54_031246 [Datura stramonium]|uniref:Uncharacterized protein n=1 Tax=Datura stramonium TaxID=4076 RepID=A0ABS8VC28_DATST|nr:hypothetical protein [Datura stramonium]